MCPHNCIAKSIKDDNNELIFQVKDKNNNSSEFGEVAKSHLNCHYKYFAINQLSKIFLGDHLELQALIILTCLQLGLDINMHKH